MEFEFHPVDIEKELARSEQPVVIIDRHFRANGCDRWTNWYVLDAPLIGDERSLTPWGRAVDGTHVAVPLFEYSTIYKRDGEMSVASDVTLLSLLALELGLRAGSRLPHEQRIELLKVYYARTRPDSRPGRGWACYFGLAARWAP